VNLPGREKEPYFLTDQCVDLWYASFDDLGDLLAEPLSILSDDERHRASRYKFASDRQKFVLARGFLRRVAGLYLGQLPSSLEFQYSPHGKPYLAAPLAFNVSHSGEIALLAFGAGNRLGVDIERIKWDMDVLEIADGFFSESEVLTLRSLEGDERQKAFFRCWARKEAFLKGLGDGLSLPLRDFDVTVLSSDPPKLLRVAWDNEAPSRWRLKDVSIDSGYMATVAMEGKSFEMRLRHAREALAIA
jgi:4'-phosphopantetheinyl transferase